MKRWSWFVIVGLLVFSLACTGLGGGGKETATPGITEAPVGATQEPGGTTQEPGGKTQEATAEPGAEVPAPVVDPAALEGLSSYRSRIVFRTDYADGNFSEIVVEQSETREPRAQQMMMTMSGEGVEGTGTMAMVQIGDMQWISFGEDQWMQSQQSPDATPEAFGSGFISFSDMASSMSKEDYDYVGKETVNGIKTRHYRLKVTPAEAAALGMGATDVKKVAGDVWIADESNLPAFSVKFVLNIEGTFKENDQEREGKATMIQEVYEVNTPFKIEPPAGAENAGLPKDIPAYPGATELFSMAGMIGFKSTDKVATVGKFYEDNLPGQGWNKEDSSMVGDMAMQTWKKEQRTLQIMISPEEAGGSSVLMTITTEE